MRIAAVALLLAGSPAVHAALCQATVTDPTFGPYQSSQPDAVDSSATVTLECVSELAAESVTFSVALGPGLAGSYDRAMSNGPERLSYNVYTDSARTVVWGDGTAGTTAAAGQMIVPSESARAIVAFGRIFGGQAVPPGGYADLLTVTVTY